MNTTRTPNETELRQWKMVSLLAIGLAVAMIVFLAIDTFKSPAVVDTLDQSDQPAIQAMCPGGTLVWPSDQETFTCWGSDPMPDK